MEPRIVELRQGILEKNDLLARGLRQRFADSGVLCVNVVSSPGTGKTALLEVVLRALIERGVRAAALVGDCATEHDAERLARSGAPVRQIVTEGICHLEADMVERHLEGWDLDDLDVLVVENVGNLVCPAGFDLGEGLRLVALSVTEGEDKPLKYPHLFASSDVAVITKTDLAEACEFDRALALANLRDVAPSAAVVETSARRHTGIDDLVELLLHHHAALGSLQPTRS
jgi:hydrogenase nickel incorporation protein HypB